MSYRARFCPAGTLAVAFIYGLGSLWAQNDRAADPLPTMERKRQQKLLNQEFRAPYKKWLNEDVFQRLMLDDEREQFIEQFWLRRDPTRIFSKTGSKRNIIAGSLMRTIISPRLSRAGRRIAGASISLTDHPMKFNRASAAAMSVRKAAKHLRIPSSGGLTDIWRESATTSSSSSPTPLCRASTP